MGTTPLEVICVCYLLYRYPGKSILDKLPLVCVKSQEASKEGIAIVKMDTNQTFSAMIVFVMKEVLPSHL